MKYTINVEVLSYDPIDSFELAEWIEELLQAELEREGSCIRVSVPQSVLVEY